MLSVYYLYLKKILRIAVAGFLVVKISFFANQKQVIMVFLLKATSLLRTKLAMTVAMFVFASTLLAQQRSITGMVKGSEDKKPISNISVQVEGSSRGAITDAKGEFKLLASTGETISFSGIGYVSTQIILTDANRLSIELAKGEGELEKVVVTALGIKREEKSLGFSQTTLQNEDLTDAVSSNWTDALSGKVAGLNMLRSGAGPTGSNKIILRGENNLTGDNEALIVVDGVVINNSSGRRTGNGSEAVYGTGSDNMPADYGTGLNDINPEDIESVTVLKGPGAAALYGQRGANGAIIITTKSSKRKKNGISFTFNSNYSQESVNRWPDMQFEYGQGLDGAPNYSYGTTVDGASTSGTSSAYGPKFEGQQFFQYDPVRQAVDSLRTPWVPYVNKIRNHFETGHTYNNTVTFDANINRTYIRGSYTNVQNTWIMPNTGYRRNTGALSINSKITDKLQVSAKVNYTNKYSDNLPGAGYGNQSIMYWFIFWQPNADLDWLKNYWVNGQNGLKIKYPYSSFPENPYAIAYQFLNRSNRNGITGNAQATYSFSKNLSLMVRTAADWSDEHRAQKRPYDAGSRMVKGSFRTQDIGAYEITTDFLIKYQKTLNKEVKITASAGGSTLRNHYDRLEFRADSLKVPGGYYFGNAAGEVYEYPWNSKYVINSFYGVFTASYKDYLFADLSARQDWNSVLASPQRKTGSGFFYPALNTSFVLSDAFKMPKSINFAKIRLSLSSVGSGSTVPYRTAYNYEIATAVFDSAYQNPSTLINPDLKPLRTNTYEIGGNIRMFQNRLDIDVAAYLGNTKNQILDRIIDRASGYSRQVINAGTVRNKGLEVTVNATLIKLKKFSWKTAVTFAANSNRIISMPDSSVVLNTGYVGGGQIVAKVGGSMGDLYGRGYVRAPDGQIVYDPTSGNALITQEVVHIGNTIPKGRVSFSNKFSYGGFTLSTLFDAQYGAIGHSLTHYKMVEQGKLAVTLPGRYNGIIGNGVVQNPDGSYRKNDVIAIDIDEYYRSHMGTDNAEGASFSTDFIKFREARFDYTLPSRFLKKWGIEKANIGIYGRNLFIWSPWPMFDPEFGTLTGSDIVKGFEVAQFPSTRTIGASLIIGF